MTAPVPPTLLTRRQFAAQVGCSHTVVNKLVSRGLLPLVDGKIPLLDGLRAYAAVRPLAAPAPASAPPHAENAPGAPAVAHGSVPAASAPLGDRAAAELERIRWQARLAELKARTVSGELIERAAALKEVEAAFGGVRAGLLVLGSRVALVILDLCASESPVTAAAIQRVIDAEVNQLLTDLYAQRPGGDA